MNKKGKHIVIVNQDSGYLMIDIANAYVEKGYNVSLITGRLVERNNPLNKKINISKILEYKRASTFLRLYTWSIATIQILFLIWFKYRKKPLLIVSNPPTTIILPLACKNPFTLLIYDIYPDALVEYRILKKNSFIIKKWKKVNASVFKKAKNIFTLNDEMKNVLSNYTAKENIGVIPIWTDNSFLKPIQKNENPFLIEHDLVDKFVIMYSGNLGRTHNLEVLLKVAEQLPDDPYFFLIIGGGDKFESIKKEIHTRKLKNMRLMSWQPTEVLPYTLAAADIGVVSLGNEASNLSIPSKTYNLMSVGVPIMSIADSNSALAKLIENKNLGMNFEHDQMLEMRNFIELVYNNKGKQQYYKENSLATSTNYGPENAHKFIV